MSTDPSRVPAIPMPPAGIKPDPPNIIGGPDVLRQEYVTHEGYGWPGVHVLPHVLDEVATNVGPETFEQMSRDPKIHKAKRIRINGVLTDDLIFAPGATEEEAATQKEFEKYQICMQFAERMVAGLDTPLWRVLEQMLDGGYEQGHKIAETIWETRLDTPTKSVQTETQKRGTKPRSALTGIKRFFGLEAVPTDSEPKERGTTLTQRPKTRLMPKAIKVKPRDSVYFVVDAFMNVLGLIPAWLEGRTTWNVRDVLTRDKFLVFVNNPTDDDPRGNSAWRPVYWAWQFKNFIPKEYLRFLLNEAVPVPVLTLGEKVPNFIEEVDDQGHVVYEDEAKTRPKMIKATVAAANTLRNIRVGKGIAIPPGSTLLAYGGNRGGGADTVFPNAIRAADEQIEEGILNQPLAQSAGRSNSQKGAVTHENRLDDLLFWDKRALCVMLLYEFIAVGVRINLGERWLRYMPKCSLGDSQKRDWARDLEVISTAYFKGFIDDTMRPELCSWLGLPKPGPSRASLMAQVGKDGTPSPQDANRPDKQPDQSKRNDGNATPKKDDAKAFFFEGQYMTGDEVMTRLYERVRDVEIADQGFSTLGHYRRRQASFVGYLSGRA